MECYRNGNVLHISVTNLEDFETLVTRAKNEAQQLSKTIDEIRTFDIKVSFETNREIT